jgi:rsbT antagonist protein RsbS
MAIPGLHLTQIGSGDFLLEATRSLNIHDQDRLLEGIASRLQHARASRLYYDLSEQALIDPVYYAWLDSLARTIRAINVRMVCIHMQPTAAFALAQFMCEKPAFETALDISGWKKTGQ